MIGFFDGHYFSPPIDSITRDEICAVVLSDLVERGWFPSHAVMLPGDPPVYVGEQIRRISDERFVVANIDFFDHQPSDDAAVRVYEDARSAVACFVRARVSNRMYGIAVL
ncbi:MAG: hypothetical protein HKN47_27800 [Pirellulaceae bacterium]|nr:hypothetical protein [Pirellulaceae bacterium]